MYIEAPRDDVVGGGPDQVPRPSPAARFFLACPNVAQDRDRTAPDSLKFVQNLVFNVSRMETKILSGVPCGRNAVDKLLKPRSTGKRKIVYSKERQIIYYILDVYICYLRKLLRA